jgi:hypothetical protein
MKTVELTKGYRAIVDDADYPTVSQFKWHAHEEFHPDRTLRDVSACRGKKQEDGTYKNQQLSRFILDIDDPKIEVDHEDHNGLNNQRYNLRVANHTQNDCNQRKQQGTSSPYKGVTLHKHTGRWQAQSQTVKNPHYLGLFKSPLTAALVYDRHAREYFKDFALVNFPTMTSLFDAVKSGAR